MFTHLRRISEKRRLERRPVKNIARSLGALSTLWLQSRYAFRRRAVQRLVTESRFSRAMAKALLDSIFNELTQKKIWKLLKAELGNPETLDGFKKNPVSGTFVRMRGPALILHIFSENVPNPAILSFVFGMLVKSVNVGKVSGRNRGILDIYLDSLRAHDPVLARSNFLLDPKDKRLLKPLFTLLPLVVAYGKNETLVRIKKELPPGAKFCGYGHRVSLAFYTRAVLTKSKAPALARKTARDIWMTDQKGCLSPVVIYAQTGGSVSPEHFSRLLTRELRKFERGWIWAVFYNEKAGKMPLGPGRHSIHVRSVRSEAEVYSALRPFQKYLQAVALECAPFERIKIAEGFSALGVNRLARAGRMQQPPITWHHDGKPNLSSWVTWTDLEI